MNSKIKKFFSLSLGLMVLSFSACHDNDLEPCNAEIIEDYTYFHNNRILTNHCTKGDGVDYRIKAESTYGFYDVTASLKVEKGTTILFEDGAGLQITGSGSISAIGTAAETITLRGEEITDKGSWRGILIDTDQTDNALEYVLVQGGGGASFNSNDNKGNIVVYADAKISINNCTIKNSASYGVNADYATSTVTSFMNNTFSNNHIPVIMHGNKVDVVDATNTFSGNDNDYVHTRVSYGNHEISTTKVWQALQVPYRITAADFGIFKHQEVGSNGRLTINAGAVVEFETQTGFDIDDTATFSAIGTATNRIKFRGVDPTAGSWDGFGFSFTQSPSNAIKYADIEHAGSNKGAIDMWADPFLTIEEVHFNKIAGCVFYDAPKQAVDPANPKLTRTNVTYTNVISQYCKGTQ